jgi:hypothetical protein
MILFHGCNNTNLEYDEKSVFITHRPTLFSEEIVEFMSTDDILFVYRELPAFLKNGTLSIASRSTDKFLKIEFSKDQLPEINAIYDYLGGFAKENAKKPLDDSDLKVNVRVCLDE